MIRIARAIWYVLRYEVFVRSYWRFPWEDST